MSIEMDNPRTILEKVDAAANLVAQIRLANMIGDKPHMEKCLDKADTLLSEAIGMMQNKCIE